MSAVGVVLNISKQRKVSAFLVCKQVGVKNMSNVILIVLKNVKNIVLRTYLC